MAFKIYCVLLLFLLPVLSSAQEKKQIRITGSPADSVFNFPLKDTTIMLHGVPQKDIFDVVKSLLHLKSKTSGTDTFIRKPVFSGVPAAGYTLQSRLVATVSGNCAFRTSDQARLSTITASAAYSQNKQFTMPIESSIWTVHNHYNIVGDYRFYKYPQSTFGLGSNSSVKDEDPMDYRYARFSEIVLRHIKGNFYLGGGYILDYHWNISHTGPLDGVHSGYSTYDTATHTVSSGLQVNLLYDTRDNSINPSRGFYAAVQYRTAFKAFGSTTNWQSVIVDLRKYYHLPAGSQNVIAFWSYDWLNLTGRPPYLDLPSTSWDSYSGTGRGYIQGRFRGSKMVYGESEYRFRISANGLFGGVAFINAQSFSAAPGTALQDVQPGYGAGLRIKLNKVSKTNIDIDYGFGTQGSKGLFINIGELF